MMFQRQDLLIWYCVKLIESGDWMWPVLSGIKRYTEQLSSLACWHLSRLSLISSPFVEQRKEMPESRWEDIVPRTISKISCYHVLSKRSLQDPSRFSIKGDFHGLHPLKMTSRKKQKMSPLLRACPLYMWLVKPMDQGHRWQVLFHVEPFFEGREQQIEIVLEEENHLFLSWS